MARPAFAKKAVTDLLEKQSGILTNSGGDFFGTSPILTSHASINPAQHGKSSPPPVAPRSQTPTAKPSPPFPPTGPNLNTSPSVAIWEITSITPPAHLTASTTPP